MFQKNDAAEGAHTLPKAPRGARIGIVAARFNPRHTSALLERCITALKAGGVAALEVARVPGALEIPYALMAVGESRFRPHALIALGCVVRGQTRHFQIVADNCARGILHAQFQLHIPIINGVLAVENEAQAKARHKNGGECAHAAIEMLNMRSEKIKLNLSARAFTKSVKKIAAAPIKKSPAKKSNALRRRKK